MSLAKIDEKEENNEKAFMPTSLLWLTQRRA
jgi:hypothetical protein